MPARAATTGAVAIAAERRVATAAGCGVLVNLGGDIAIAGRAPHGGWRIEVTDELPVDQADGQRARRARGQVVRIDSGGLATSCTASRGWRRGEEHVRARPHLPLPGHRLRAERDTQLSAELSVWAAISGRDPGSQ